MNSLNSPTIGPEPGAPGIATQEIDGVKPIAYRIAGGFLVVSSILSLVSLLFGGGPNVIALIIDIGIAIGLFRLSAGARGFALFRAWAGAILWPILLFLQQSDVLTAVLLSVIQIAYCGSLILILQKNTKDWKIYAAVGIFVVFVLCGLSSLYVLAFLGSTLQ